MDKADPFGFCHEIPPRTASVVWDLAYQWQDDKWMKERGDRFKLESPVSSYEYISGRGGVRPRNLSAG